MHVGSPFSGRGKMEMPCFRPTNPDDRSRNALVCRMFLRFPKSSMILRVYQGLCYGVVWGCTHTSSFH